MALRTNDEQRRIAFKAIQIAGHMTANDLADSIKVSENWARAILADLLSLGQVKMVGKQNRKTIYAPGDSQVLPILNFTTGAVPPTLLVSHSNSGVESKDLAAALKMNVAIMDNLLGFYRNRLDEAQRLSVGGSPRKSSAQDARVYQMSCLRDLEQLHDVIQANLVNPNWFNEDALANMPKSKYWTGKLPLIPSTEDNEPDVVEDILNG